MLIFADGEPMSGGAYTLVVIGCIGLIVFVNYLSRYGMNLRQLKKRHVAPLKRCERNSVGRKLKKPTGCAGKRCVSETRN